MKRTIVVTKIAKLEIAIAGFDENPDFHDFQHKRFSCCYGNIGWLDALHGTSKMYFDERKRLQAAFEQRQAD